MPVIDLGSGAVDTSQSTTPNIIDLDSGAFLPTQGKEPESVPLSERFASDLPEIGSSPEFNELSTRALKGSLAASLMTDQQESAKALEGIFSGSDITTDAEGSRIINLPSGSYAINKPGLSGQDIAQFATRAALYAMPVARPGAALGTLGRVGAETAAIEAATQGAETALGGDFNPEDVVISGIAGAGGQIVGEKVLAPVIKGVASKITNSQARSLLAKNAPTINTLKDAARSIYDQIDDAGVRIKPSLFVNVKDSAIKAMYKEGLSKNPSVASQITPKAQGLVSQLDDIDPTTITLGELERIRRGAMKIAGEKGSADSNFARIVVDHVDDLLSSVDDQSVIGRGVALIDGKPASKALKDARNLWSRAKKSELVQEAIDLAETRRSGTDLGLRNEFANLNRKIIRGTVKGFTPEEKAAIKAVSDGKFFHNMATNLGRLGIPEDQATNSLLLTMAGAAGATGLVGPGGGVGVVAAVGVPSIFRRLASSATKRNSRLADAIVRSSNNANQVVRAYIENVPKTQRSSAELSGILLNSGIAPESLKNTGNALIDNAIWGAKAALAVEAAEAAREKTNQAEEAEE